METTSTRVSRGPVKLESGLVSVFPQKGSVSEMAANPNEYDEDRYNQGSSDLGGAVEELWEAGAEESDIRKQFEDALETAKG